MSARPFRRSLLFAAAAACAWPGVALALGAGSRGFAAAALGAVALHAAALADGPRRALGAVALAAALGALALALAPASPAPWLAAAGIAAVVRLAVLAPGGGARRLAAELGVGVASVALARALQGPGLLGEALALWGFLLTQSGYWLLPIAGRRAHGDANTSGDPFDAAARRLRDVLGEDAARVQ